MAPWRNRLHKIIFEAETPAGKTFDIVLIILISLSVCAVSLESVAWIDQAHGSTLRIVEGVLTFLFTLEYLLRLLCATRPFSYARSFFGVVDLLAILPTYISLFLPGSHYLLVIRALRVLRVFRVLKLAQYIREAQHLRQALYTSRRKITVFIFTVLTLVLIVGAMMYVIEGEANGFTSIPRSLYWAIVTLTTVGYGDIIPQTVPGQALAAVVMVLGYGIIAVPTGIVTVELAQAASQPISIRVCRACASEDHDADAQYCKYCGTQL